jgi:hypothetical protein
LPNYSIDLRVHICTDPEFTMRHHLSFALQKVVTEYFIIADDYSIRASAMLPYLLAPLEQDPRVGGVNFLQRVDPSSGAHFSVFESFGALNLTRRNILHAGLAYWNRGQVLSLAGRLTAYRTHVFHRDDRAAALTAYFTTELWAGRHLVRTGDDNAMTRWCVQHGWRTAFQN